MQPLELDITDPGAVSHAAATAFDVDLLVNNAAIALAGESITGPEDELRRVFETNFFGTLRVANAFAPVLAANGGGTLLNILSSASWLPVRTGYAASKAAMWSATNGLRLALQAQGTQVIGLQVGMIDTSMSTRWAVPKVSAESVAAEAYDGVASGLIEVLADDTTRDLKTQLGTPTEAFYPSLHQQLAGFSA